MNSLKAKWATKQPGRGIFVLIVTAIIAFIITGSFNIGTYSNFFGYLVMSCIGMFVVLGALWKGKSLPMENIPQPLSGLLLVLFAFCWGTLVCFGLIKFLGGGALHPYVALHTILSIITTFFLFLAFNFWPFTKLSLPAAGFTFIVTAYTISFCLMQLFNFNELSYPAGIKPSPIGSVPLYVEGGPLSVFFAPSGPFLWEHAITYAITSVVFLWCFAILGMWPFNKFNLKQPAFGIAITVTCLILGAITFNIAVNMMNIEPLLFMSYAISIIFGVLITLTIFQTWPGNKLDNPLIGGFVNLGFSIVIGVIGYLIVRSFCYWHFGETMTYPDGLFALDTMMLGLLFPMWAAYGDLLDFWPLPLPPKEE
ncbi:MAG: hypothetical protein M0P77_02040 [Firmicutes bacterium]|nr:hypothetical protein [Bacillota bacterium]